MVDQEKNKITKQGIKIINDDETKKISMEKIVGKFKENLKKIDIYFFIILIAILFVISFRVKFDFDLDDIRGINNIRNNYSNFFDYILSSYLGGSGRILPNIFTYIFSKFEWFIGTWRIFNVAVIIVLICGIVRMLRGKVQLRDINILLILFGTFSMRLLSSSTFWFVGSFNYLWPAAVAVFALIPIADYFFRNKEITINKKNILFYFCAALSMISTEQVACLVLAFYILAVFYKLFIRKTRVSKFEIGMIVLLILLFLTLVCSPSLKSRYNDNNEKTENELASQTFLQRTNSNITWTFDKAFSEQRLLIFALGISTVICYKEKSKNNKVFKTIYTIFSAMLMFAVTIIGICACRYAGIDINEYLYTFNKLSLSHASLKMFAPYIFWLIYTVLQICLIAYGSKNPILDIICIFAALCTVGIMWFSPTMYLSGNRTWFVFGVIIIYLAYKMYYENGKSINLGLTLISIANLILFADLLGPIYAVYY